MEEVLSYTKCYVGRRLDLQFEGVRTPAALRRQLKDLGFEYKKKLHTWQGWRNHDEAIMLCDAAVKHYHNRKVQKFSRTLCENCRNIYGRCSYSDGTFTPVKGWTAEKIVTQAYYTSTENGVTKNYPYDRVTYCVTDCPKFEPDRR